MWIFIYWESEKKCGHEMEHQQANKMSIGWDIGVLDKFYSEQKNEVGLKDCHQ